MYVPVQAAPIARSSRGILPASGNVRPSDICASATTGNGQVCINVPILGNLCVPAPVPGGLTAQVCADICTKWGIPCGASVSASVVGYPVFSKSFGCC